MFLFQYATKGKEASKSGEMAFFTNGMQSLNAFTSGMASAQALEQKMGELRSLVAGSKQLASAIAGNKELASAWQNINRNFEELLKNKVQGATYYTPGDFGFSQIGENARAALNALSGIKKEEMIAPVREGFVASTQKPEALQIGASGKITGIYSEVMDKLDAMQKAIEDGRPDIALQFGSQIIKSGAYAGLLKNSPAFRELFENAMYSLKAVDIVSPEGKALLKSLQNEFATVNRKAIDAHTASVPEGLSSAQRNVMLADAYGSLQDIKFNLIKSAYLESISLALKDKDMERANTLLDGLAVVTDVRYGILRYEPEKGGQAGAGQPNVQEFTSAQDMTSRNRQAPATGMAYLPNTPEARFAEGTDLDRLNKAVLSGKIEAAKTLADRLDGRMLYSNELAAKKPGFEAPEIKLYSDRLQLSAMFGINGAPSALNLAPFYSAATEVIDAAKDLKAGDYSTLAYHAGAALTYLMLDIAAIYTGGMSKAATALMKSAQAVRRMASIGKGTTKLAGALDDLSGLLKLANKEGIVTAERVAELEKKVKDVRAMAEQVSKRSNIVADEGRDIILKGGLKDFESGIKINTIAKQPAKLETKLTTTLKEVDEKVQQAKQTIQDAPGGVVENPATGQFTRQLKPIDKATSKYSLLGKRFDDMSVSLENSMNRIWTPAGLMNKTIDEGRGAIQNLQKIKPILSSEKASYMKFFDELEDGAKQGIKGLADGQHCTVTINGKGMTGRFTFAKQDGKTLVYRASEYEELLKGMSSKTAAIPGKLESKGGKNWGKKLDELVPLDENTYNDLVKTLSFTQRRELNALENGKTFDVKIDKTVYTFAKDDAGTVAAYEQSVYKSYNKKYKKLKETVTEKAAEKGKDVLDKAQRARDLLTTVPKRTLEYTIYRPQEWRGLRPVGFEDWGVVPTKINEGTDWLRNSRALSKETIKKNFGRIPAQDVKDAGTLHGLHGKAPTFLPAYGAGYAIGTLSGVGHGLTYPAQLVGWGISGAAGAVGLMGEGVLGFVGKTVDFALTTTLRQRVRYMAGRYAVASLQENVLTPDNLGIRGKWTAGQRAVSDEKKAVQENNAEQYTYKLTETTSSSGKPAVQVEILGKDGKAYEGTVNAFENGKQFATDKTIGALSNFLIVGPEKGKTYKITNQDGNELASFVY